MEFSINAGYVIILVLVPAIYGWFHLLRLAWKHYVKKEED